MQRWRRRAVRGRPEPELLHRHRARAGNECGQLVYENGAPAGREGEREREHTLLTLRHFEVMLGR